MYYTIYKITNTINNKFYIGKHQTKNLDDGYMGSGKLIRQAIVKYGIENFVKEILYVFDNEAEMNAKEAELVVISEDSYNLCPGGHGGFGYVNSNNLNVSITEQMCRNPDLVDKASKVGNARKKLLWETDSNWRQNYSEIMSAAIKKRVKNPFLGKKHTEETKQKMRKSKNVGDANSQHGTMWITNGTDNKKIKKDVDLIPEGWYNGRVIIIDLHQSWGNSAEDAAVL